MRPRRKREQDPLVQLDRDLSKRRTKRQKTSEVLDPSELLLEAISRGLEAGYAELDDRDIPRAPNILDWLTSPQFLNVRPYATQLTDAIFIFTGVCFYCSDTAWLVNVPVDASISDVYDRSTPMHFGRCPKCRRRAYDMRREWCLDPTNTFGGRIKAEPPNDACLIEGQRSGKSAKTAMYATWVLHRYLRLPNPTRYFGLMENVGALHGTFVSVTATQARENLWQPFSDLIDSSPWFKSYHRWLNDQSKSLGITLWHKPDTYLWYGHKRLAMSYSPADKRTLRGRTRFISCVDELGWLFTGGKEKEKTGTEKIRADGDGTVRALDRSLATIRNFSARKRPYKQDCPDAYLFTISSPSSATDPIERRACNADKAPRMFHIRRPTWLANPGFTEVTLRAQEVGTSDRDFNCDFACIPPFSQNPWWEAPHQLLDLCAKVDDRLWLGGPEFIPDPTGAARYLTYVFSQLNTDKMTPRVLAFDTGEKTCSFAWALARFDKGSNTVIVDDVGELAPGEGDQIHLGQIWETLIKRLVENFNLQHVVWDRWESSRYVADLRTIYKVRADQYTATMKDGKLISSDMLNSKIVFPQPECSIDEIKQLINSNVELARRPRSHLLLQMLTARNARGLPIKPEGGNDDILRAVLLAHAAIRMNPEVYGRYQASGGHRAVGIGVGGRIMGGVGAGVFIGANGRAIGVGPRR